MNKKILVTGSNGFVGKHLMYELAAQGWSPVGLSREDEPVPENKQYPYMHCDLSDEGSVSKIPLEGVRAVINLAGLAAVGPSFDNPDLYMKVNVEVLTNLADHIIASQRKNIRIIAVSSGAVYSSQQDLPLTESSTLDPDSSPYAKSKIAMEESAQNYTKKGVECIVVRPFNHIGPGQNQGFLLPDLFAKIKALPDRKTSIAVGNITTQRDYTDVRDVAKAYVAVATEPKLKNNIYNVCTGRPVSGETIFDTLKDVLGRSDTEAVQDEKLFRPSDSPILYGDNSRIKQETKWEPSISLKQTVADFAQSA